MIEAGRTGVSSRPVIVLLRHNAVWLWRSWFVRSKRGWIGAAALVFVGLLMTTGMTTFFIGLRRIDPTLAPAYLTAAFPLTALLMILGSATMWLDRLFLDPDLELLMAAPVPLLDVYVFKVARVVVSTGAIVGTMKMCVLFAYGIAADAGSEFYGAAAVVTAAQLAITTLLALLLLTLLARLVPPRRLRAVLVVLGPLQGLGYALVVPALSASSSTPGRARTLQDIGRTIGSVRRAAGWSPTTWGSDALIDLQAGRRVAVLGNIGLLLVLVAVLLCVGYVVFRATFYESLGRVREMGGARRARRSNLDSVLRPLPVQIRAMAVKDWRMLARDPRALTSLIMPMAMLVVFGWRSSARSSGFSQVPIMLMFVAMPTLSAFVSEGKGFPLMRIAPLRTRDVFWAKYVANLTPALLLAWAVTAVLALSRHEAAGRAALGIVMFSWIVGGVVLTHLAVAAATSSGAIDRGARPAAGLIFLPLLALDGLLSAPSFALLALVSAGRLTGVLGAALVPAILGSLAANLSIARWGIRRLDAWEPKS
jgi:hypothetical protein